MQVILITGSTRGIGYCLAEYLLRKDYKLVIHGQNIENINKIKKNISDDDKVKYICLNLLEENPLDIIDFAISSFGGLDILINNAGIAIKNDNSDSQMNLNAQIPYQLSKYALQKGVKKIINVSSGGAISYNKDFMEYCLSKKVLENISKNLAFQYYKESIVTGIRIDLSLKTDMTKSIFDADVYNSFKEVNIVLPLFLYLIKGGMEISGKIYSLGRSLINFNMEIQLNTKYIDKKPISLYDDKTKFYCTGENTFSPELGYYPRDQLILKLENKVLESLSNQNKNLEIDNITLIQGGISGCFDYLCKLFINEGDEIICHTLTFDYVLSSVDLRGGFVKYVRPDLIVEKNEMEYYLDKILENINSNTKIIYLVHPTYILCDSFDEDKFEEFLSKIPFNILVVLDECYIQYLEKNCMNSLKYINKYSIFSLRSFSKMHGLASTRLGYIVCNKKYKSILYNCQTLKSIPEQTVECILENFDNVYELKKLFFAERKYVVNLLNKLKINYLGKGLFLIIFFKNNDIFEMSKEYNIILPKNSLFPGTITYQIGTRENNKHFMNILQKLHFSS